MTSRAMPPAGDFKAKPIMPLIAKHFNEGKWIDVQPCMYEVVIPPDEIKLLSWNVDFMAENAGKRLLSALAHIREVLSGHPPNVYDAPSVPPCCVLLQELRGDVFLAHKWVRQHFAVIPQSSKDWPTPSYGVVTLVSNNVPVLDAHSLVFRNSQMGRNVLLADVRLSLPGSAGGKEKRTRVLRIGNVHLESLPQRTSRRPGQLSATSERLRAPGVDAGVVGGDMNAIVPADAMIHVNAGLEDAYRGPADDEASFIWGYQPWNTRFPRNRLDKIFFTKGSPVVVDEPRKVGVGLKTNEGQWASDHYGLVTTVKFKNNEV